MKLKTMFAVAVLGVLTVVLTAATDGRAALKLPLPQTVHTPPSRAGTAPVAPPTVGSGGYVASPLPALDGCSVSVSDPAPPRGQTAETVTVSTTAGAEIRLEADYVRTHSVHTAIADGSGHAYFALSISHAEPGVTVDVSAMVSLGGLKDSCSTSFTPTYYPAAAPSTGGGQ